MLSNLKSLALTYSDLQDVEAEMLASAIDVACLLFLKHLKLQRLQSASGELKNLTEFDLSNNCLYTNRGKGHLILARHMRSGQMHALESLNLEHNPMTGEDYEAYVNAITSGELPSLSCIWFAPNCIGNKGAEALERAIQSGALMNLAELDLSRNEITDGGMTFLANSFQEGDIGILLNLRSLNLPENDFTKAGLLSLAEALSSGRLNSLEILSLRTQSLSKEGANALVFAFFNNINFTVDADYAWYEFPNLHRCIEQLRKRNFLSKKDISAGLVDSLVVPATFAKVYIRGNSNAGKTIIVRGCKGATLRRCGRGGLIPRSAPEG